MAANALAPAKINLALHVTGQRDDGYHLIDTLVVFADDLGDRVSVAPADALTLEVTGPMADGVPKNASNLVMQAAHALRAHHNITAGAAITLEKHLPNGAGLGGGSSDAATAIRLLANQWNVSPLPTNAALTLGADLPMCMAQTPLRATGIGEAIAPQNLPPLHLILANPGVAVETGAVFKSLTTRENPPLPDDMPKTATALANWLTHQRNDLETTTCAQHAAVATTLLSLKTLPGCRLARMSGSGSTCFGLFDDASAAQTAAAQLQATNPDLWVRAIQTGI